MRTDQPRQIDQCCRSRFTETVRCLEI